MTTFTLEVLEMSRDQLKVEIAEARAEYEHELRLNRDHEILEPLDRKVWRLRSRLQKTLNALQVVETRREVERLVRQLWNDNTDYGNRRKHVDAEITHALNRLVDAASGAGAVT